MKSFSCVSPERGREHGLRKKVAPWLASTPVLSHRSVLAPPILGQITETVEAVGLAIGRGLKKTSPDLGLGKEVEEK